MSVGSQDDDNMCTMKGVSFYACYIVTPTLSRVNVAALCVTWTPNLTSCDDVGDDTSSSKVLILVYDGSLRSHPTHH